MTEHKKPRTYNAVMVARSALRRAFSRSPLVISLMNDSATKRHIPAFKKDGTRAKVDAVEHLCAYCGQWKHSTRGRKFAIDHKTPVVDPELGFVDFNTYFIKMWCDAHNLFKVCFECHKEKSNKENAVRRIKTDIDLVNQMWNDPANLQDRMRLLKKFTTDRLSRLPEETQKKILNLRRRR